MWITRDIEFNSEKPTCTNYLLYFKGDKKKKNNNNETHFSSRTDPLVRGRYSFYFVSRVIH